MHECHDSPQGTCILFILSHFDDESDSSDQYYVAWMVNEAFRIPVMSYIAKWWLEIHKTLAMYISKGLCYYYPPLIYLNASQQICIP